MCAASAAALASLIQLIAGDRDARAADEAADVSPAADVSIEVNIPATELLLSEDGVPVFRRPVAIGQGVYPTPEQESAIQRIEWNPWWYPPPDAPWAKDAKPTPPGPGNPLGFVKMPLSGEILFHGTNKERSVGHAASHGCMRMYNRDIAEIAWYLQERFSEKADPALRELYRKNRSTTYRVELSTPIPVRLVYRPCVVREEQLSLYPDHYGKVWGRKKAAILTELIRAGYGVEEIDAALVEQLAKEWPMNAPVPVVELLREKPERPTMDGLECS
jgi:murein L,D-transpeptidase YcbB/YkuD